MLEYMFWICVIELCNLNLTLDGSGQATYPSLSIEREVRLLKERWVQFIFRVLHCVFGVLCFVFMKVQSVFVVLLLIFERLQCVFEYVHAIFVHLQSVF